MREMPADLTEVPKVEALRGKNGWLFLAGDRWQVLRQHSGDLLFSEAALKKWKDTLEVRVQWLRGLGIPYHYLVIPNKEEVYAEQLPDEITSNGHRPITQLRDYLAETGSSFSFIYPLTELMAAKKQRDVYLKTDTHWNALGAFVAYGRLAEEVNRTVPIPILSRDDVEFAESEEPTREGDLGSKLDPPEKSKRLVRRGRRHSCRVTYDNGIDSVGRLVVLETDGLDGPACVLFGDSFSYALLTYLADSFARLVFAHRPTFDHALITREKPDVVLSSNIERFLIRVPDDAEALTTEELASRKKELGRTLTAAQLERFATGLQSGNQHFL